MDSLDIDLFTSVFLPFSGRLVDTIEYVRNEGDLDKVVLVFGGDSLVIEVDPNYDTVRVFQKPYEQLSQLQIVFEDVPETWAKYIGTNSAGAGLRSINKILLMEFY